MRYNKKGLHLYQTNTLCNVNYVSGFERYTLSVMRCCLECKFSEKYVKKSDKLNLVSFIYFMQ